jgi:multicomponent Na+:H+ antiporter subunit F
MTGFVLFVTGAVALTMGLSLYRVLVGPTIFDRVLCVGLIGTKSTILLLLLGVLAGKLEALVDIALAYSLIALVTMLTLAKYLERTEVPR